jgi:hypothetical protein
MPTTIQPQSAAVIKNLRENFNKYIKFIADRTYLLPFPSKAKINYGDDVANRTFSNLLFKTDYVVTLQSLNERSRIIHGLTHACRVAVYVVVLHNFQKIVIHSAAENSFPVKAMRFFTEKFGIAEDTILILTKIAAFFHDSARESDATEDYWDARSAENYYDFLVNIGVTEQLARFFANSIKYKDAQQLSCNIIEKYYRELFENLSEEEVAYCHYIRNLINAADTVDVMRCAPEFYGFYLDHFFGIGITPACQDKIAQLFINIYNCINAQHNIFTEEPCKIILKKPDSSECYIIPNSDMVLNKFKSIQGVMFHTVVGFAIDPYGFILGNIQKNQQLSQFLLEETSLASSSLMAVSLVPTLSLQSSSQSSVLSTINPLAIDDTAGLATAIYFEGKLDRVLIPIQRTIRARKRLIEHEAIFKCKPQNFSYIPKCNKMLLDRILNQTTKLSPISEIKHLSDAVFLKSILDGALYGRETLTKHRIAFSPSNLSPEDEVNGDSNVICFGIDKLDSTAMGVGDPSIVPKKQRVILLNVKCEETTNPCRFVKDHDLGWNRPDPLKTPYDEYASSGYRKLVTCGRLKFSLFRNNSIFLVHYKNINITMGGYLALMQLNKKANQSELGWLAKNVSIPKFNSPHHNHRLFYGNNIKQFFIMQFFRYIDQFDKISSMPNQPINTTNYADLYKEVMLNLNGDQEITTEEFFRIASEFKNVLYQELDRVTNEQLSEFLETIFKVMSEGAEYNFYGSYKIPIENLKSIFAQKLNYWDDLQSLLQERINLQRAKKKITDYELCLGAIKTNDFKQLQKLRSRIPAIYFNGYCTTVIEKKLSHCRIPGYQTNKAAEEVCIILQQAYKSTYRDWYVIINIEDIKSAVKYNNVLALKSFMEMIPELFNSYRFLRYLLCSVKGNSDTTALLEASLRKAMHGNDLNRLGYITDRFSKALSTEVEFSRKDPKLLFSTAVTTKQSCNSAGVGSTVTSSLRHNTKKHHGKNIHKKRY